MTAASPKRLIEVDLPIKRISAHARREKSIRHGHISTLHIWPARRPLAACRAALIATLLPDPGVRHTAYQAGSGIGVFGPRAQLHPRAQDKPLDSTTHAPSVRRREGLWYLDDRRVRSLRAPEPGVVVPIRGRVPVAVRRAHVERVIVPPAAAQDGLVRPGPRLRSLHSAQAFCGKQ